MEVKVVPYNPDWERMYRQESFCLRNILRNELVAIYHIGSTSVPGLAAKPIIDIMPVVKDINRIDRLNLEFERLGYECMGEFGISGRRYFRKGGDNRTHQMHVFQQDNRTDIDRHLAVRDYLRTHPSEAAHYGALKQGLALRFPHDIEGYCDGKDGFMKQLEAKALAWYASDAAAVLSVKPVLFILSGLPGSGAFE